MEFFFGPDDQIKQMQCGLQFGRHSGGFDEPAFAITMARQTPKVGAIVDVQGGLQPMLARQMQRLHHGGFGARIGQMRSRGHDGTGRGNEALVNVIFAQRHIGAVFAVEDQGKLLLIADAQQNQSRQPVRIGLHALHIDAFARQFLADEAAHMLVAYAGDQG